MEPIDVKHFNSKTHCILLDIAKQLCITEKELKQLFETVDLFYDDKPTQSMYDNELAILYDFHLGCDYYITRYNKELVLLFIDELLNELNS